MAIYAGNWSSYEDIKQDASGYDLPPEEQILFASYDTPDYEGYSMIVWRDKDGQLWENHDSHCSCYGLEAWCPEKTTREAILMREENTWMGCPASLRELLEKGA